MLDSLAQAAATADPVAFFVASAVAAIVSGTALYRGLHAFWKLRLIVDTPTARIRSAPQGYVELQGLARPQRDLLSARLTGLPCVWYRYRVQKRRRSGRNESWVTIDSGDAGCPFVLDDGTGRCLVDPDGAAIRCRSSDTWYGPRGGGRAATATGMNALVERHRRYRMTEERIAEQELVYVLGRFETPRRGVRERQQLTRQLLSQWKRDPERMHAFDHDGNGGIDLEEWEQARTKAERLAEQAESRLSAEPPLSRVIRTEDPSQPFVISTEEEQSIASHLRWHAFGGTTVGLLAGIGLAFTLLARAIS